MTLDFDLPMLVAGVAAGCFAAGFYRIAYTSAAGTLGRMLATMTAVVLSLVSLGSTLMWAPDLMRLGGPILLGLGALGVLGWAVAAALRPVDPRAPRTRIWS